MPNPKGQWVYDPNKTVSPKASDALKRKVETEANALIDTVLKPQYIQPPPEDPQFNYLVNLYGKWRGGYFYFCSQYACPGPNAILPFFDDKFARLEYVGGDRFNLSFLRHTGQWIEIYPNRSLDECRRGAIYGFRLGI